ncbi:MAG: SRPBCC family protein, partial [Pigmentiphaga sp.]
GNAFAAWTFDRPNAESLMKTFNERMSFVQSQDTSCCENLQKGLRSSFNKKSVIHPFETQLSHFYQWMLGQYQK